MKKVVLAAALVTAFAGGVALTEWREEARIASPVNAATQAAQGTPAPVAADAAPVAGLPDFSALVERVGPAVVNIAVAAKAAPPVQGPPGAPPQDPFEFFRRFQPQPGPGPGDEGPQRQGVGSGFIVSADGYVLTNTHVVKGAETVTVRLTDKREFEARVIGADERTDVALLKIDGRDLPAVRIGDPSRLKVGNWVAAIGSPFGFDNTVTAGIVSAKSRTLPSDAYVPFIQTDVAVNPGNSGGPLFNLAGEVVGINAQIFSRTGGYMGVSFAIPIDVAMKVREDLTAFGKVQRGRIAVTIQQVSKELAGSFGLDRPRGALVSGVEKGGPGEAAGLKPGDVILSVDGQAVEQSMDLPRMIGERRPGSSVALEVWRDGKARRVDVKLGETPGEKVAAVEAPAVSRAVQLGLAVRPLTAAERGRAGGVPGLVVERAEGAAARAGIRRGDVILAVNSEVVDSVEALRRLVDGARDRVAVLVQRADSRFFVPVPLS